MNRLYYILSVVLLLCCSKAHADWDSYPTYEEYEGMVYQFAIDHPDRCEIMELGTLRSGRKLLVIHIKKDFETAKPKFFYGSTLHGDETTGWMLLLRLADYILEQESEPECENLLNNLDLYICPNMNPDGTYHGGNHTVNGATRENAYGIDLNRNFPDPRGSAHPDGQEYASETQWLMQLAEDQHFVMAAIFHSGEEVVNYPWDGTYELHPDDAWFQLISHEYADLAHQVQPNYMSEFDNGITNGAQWYLKDGDIQDYMTGYTQCRALQIECSTTKLPFAIKMPIYWEYNKNSLFALMNQCIYGIHGTVTDKETGAPLEATVTIKDHDDEYSIVSSHLPAGDYHRPIKAGTYTLTFFANGYNPHQETVTVVDGETFLLNVQLEAGEGSIPDFTASTKIVGLGGSVDFKDASWGAHIVSWEWTFEGATPATSTEQNPKGITYNELGDYDVTLKVTNADGQSETVTYDNYISVMPVFNMQNGTFTTGDALFYDDGGPQSNYGDNKDLVMTFIPSTPGAILTVEFLEFATENVYDILYIHNGTTTDAEQIGKYSGNNSPGRVIASNEAGALTFHFKSDYSMNDAGWKARISTLELGGITAVSNATDKKHKEEIDNNAWFMLDGRRLKSKPTQKGIYIRNGKKIAIK